MSLNVTLRQVRAFIAVAKNGSFSKAARVVGLSQPAITLNVRTLEDMIQVRLFDRDTRNVELTEAGKNFFAATERLVGEFDTIMADASTAGQNLSGEVVVASVPSLASSLVGPVMSQFKELYRDITVKLFDGDEHLVVHRVHTRQADFGLCARLEDNPDLKFQPLIQDDFCAIFPKGHPLGDMPRVRLRDLKPYPFLATARKMGVRNALEYSLVQSNLRFNVVCELEQISTLCGMIEGGIGVSALPALTLPIIPRTNIVAQRLVDPVVRRELGIVSHRRRSLSPVADSFRNAVLEFLLGGWLESIIDSIGAESVRLLPEARTFTNTGADHAYRSGHLNLDRSRGSKTRT